MKIQKNYPLADETTIKIGGKAELFLPVETKLQLETAAKEARNQETKITILGGGSNVLISSAGVEGLVIKLRSGKIEKLEENLISVDAGVSLPRLSRFALENGYKGLEWAMGVPGSFGGAVYGNAGAFGDCTSDLISRVEVLKGQEKITINKEDIDFGYRNSTFKKQDLIILSAVLSFEKGDKKKIEEKTRKYLKYRESNHPMSMPSAGSTFKNNKTVIENESLLNEYPMIKEFNEKGVIPSGYLIEKAGLKEFKVGGAMISKRHANFIINYNQATSKDVANLIKEVKSKVFDKFEVKLEEEIRYIN
jgi:UDP-N-acetylmuramate dehydrogenase